MLKKKKRRSELQVLWKTTVPYHLHELTLTHSRETQTPTRKEDQTQETAKGRVAKTKEKARWLLHLQGFFFQRGSTLWNGMHHGKVQHSSSTEFWLLEVAQQLRPSVNVKMTWSLRHNSKVEQDTYNHEFYIHVNFLTVFTILRGFFVL